MGQFLPEVRGVFKLIEQHKKDLERDIRASSDKNVRRVRKTGPGKKNVTED